MVEHKMDYVDFQIQEVFEGLCEQIVDYLGVEVGRKFLYDNFPNFVAEIDIKIESIENGVRITRKTQIPDSEIVRICEGYK